MKNFRSLPNLFFVFCFLSPALLRAQVIDWVNLPGSFKADVAEDVAVDFAGNSYLTGKFSLSLDLGDTTLESAGKEDIFIAKYDSDGNFLWARREGGPSEDIGVEIDVDAAGSVYVGGRFEGTATFDTTSYPSQGNVDMFVIKYDTDGNFQWVNTLGGSRDDRCRGLYVDPAGFAYIGGRYRLSTKLDAITLTGQGEEDVFLAKLSQSGNVIWATTFGGLRKDFGEDITGDPAGNLYMTGSYFQQINFPDTTYFALGDEEIFVAKFDNDGNYLWSRTMGSNVRDYGEALNCDEFGNLYVGGAFSGEGYFGQDTLQSRGELDMFLIKMNPEGDVLWSFSAGAPINNDVVWAVSCDDRGNAFMSGWFKGLMTFGDTTVLGANSYNIFAGKINAAGKATWVTKLGNTNSEDIGRGVYCDPSGNVHVAGGYMGTATYGSVTTTALGNYDILHAKLNSGQDDCAISHVYVGEPTDCSLGDTAYDISMTIYHYFAPDSGQLNVNGQLFPIGGNEQTVTLTGLEPIGGFKDVDIFFTDNPACSFHIPNAYITPESCDPCAISNVTLVSVGNCKVSTNRYTAKLRVNYTKAPASGFLVVNGVEFPITSSPQVIDLPNLYSDGLPVDVNVYFSEDPFCSFQASSLFTAPASCSTCRISAIVVNSVGECNPMDTSYTAEVGLAFRAWPPSGGVLVNGQLFDIVTPPMTVTLTELIPDGLPVDLMVVFENDSLCGDTLLSAYTAPPACDTCTILSISVGNLGRCNPLDSTFSSEFLLTYTNPPLTDSINVNGQLFPITGSPQVVVVEGLIGNGLPVSITAFFTDAPSCLLTDPAVFTAPDTCLDCLITNLALSNINSCDPFTNTYDAELQIDYLNAPAEGSLFVGGQTFPILTSPQIVVLTGLVADSLPEDFTAFFANDVVCAIDAPSLYVAPASCEAICEITNISLLNLTDNCDPFTNTYEVELQIEYLYPPLDGNLIVAGQSFPLGISPQSVVVTGLLADNLPEDFSAFFTSDSACSILDTAVYVAPAPCDTCGMPRNLRHTLNPLQPSSVLVEWDPVPNATVYRLRGRRLPSMAFGQVNAFTNGKVVNNLIPGKTYAWKVSAECPYDISAYAPEDTFTLFTARLMDTEGALGAKLSLFPNPSTGPTQVFLQSTERADIRIRLTDLQGKLLQQFIQAGAPGTNAIPMDLSLLSEGLYLVEVTQGMESGVLRVQITR